MRSRICCRDCAGALILPPRWLEVALGPPLVEGLARQAAQIAGLGPLAADAGQRVNPSVFAREEAQADAAEALRGVEEPGAREEQVGDAQAKIHGIEEAAGLVALLIDDLGAQFEQHFRNVDLDRANLVAGAAERGGVRQRSARDASA